MQVALEEMAILHVLVAYFPPSHMSNAINGHVSCHSC